MYVFSRLIPSKRCAPADSICSYSLKSSARAPISLSRQLAARFTGIRRLTHGIALIASLLCTQHNTVLAQGQRAEPDVATHRTQSVAYANVQRIDVTDDQRTVLLKAARVLPRKNQVSWMRMERTFFIHFGPNTFRGVEWGSGQEDPSVFNPSQLDADQWMRTVKQAGGRLVILVCKHHDGFTLWPTRYTTHSVAASPWRGGHGDEVAEVAQAARKYGIELGIYLSPADLYQLHTNPSNLHGYYGDGSPASASVIPTDPKRFVSDPLQQREVGTGAPVFKFAVDDYNRYFLNQLYELLTQYGPIREVWFDGANPARGVAQEYDFKAWYSLVRQLQPEAIIFGKGPDGRWIGNEKGVGRKTEWDVIPLPITPASYTWPDMTAEDLGGPAKLVPGSYLWWYPAETDAPILHGWFWSPTKPCRTSTELLDMYYTSVGRNSNWLLNLSPDKRGLIPEDQIAQLQGMAKILDLTFASNLADGATIVSDSNEAGHPARAMLDGNPDTWWEGLPKHKEASVIFHLRRPETFDVLSFQEAVAQRGQRISSFAIDVWQADGWKEVERGTTIGHKRLLRLMHPVTSDRVRVRILASRLEPTLAEFGLYKQPDIQQPPTISQRDQKGLVSLLGTSGRPLVFTIDGSTPDTESKRYAGPIDASAGLTLQAAEVMKDGTVGLVSEKRFIGMSPRGWRFVAPSGTSGSEPSVKLAFDDDESTEWTAEQDRTSDALPTLTVDMGATSRIAGFAYLPPQFSQKGTVLDFQFESSVDGVHWKVNVAHGSFANIRNNPDYQIIRFAPCSARYIRFVPLTVLDAVKAVSIAELTVLPATNSSTSLGGVKGLEELGN